MTTHSHDESPAALPRATVGPYTLLAKIGEGGMGVVHLARKGEGPRVALKVMRPHIVGDDEARRRLAQEVGSLSRIRSKWVAEIVDADPWAEIPYVATRYVPGLSLHDHIVHEGPVEGGDLLWFAGCLAEGLAAVHGAGVLHRDVKPSNVLLEGRTPILIDFGLARVADDPRLTHTGWLLGTPGYLAPEILYGEDASAASDLHSWGATVAFAATGRPPFGRGPSMAIMDRVRRGEHDLSGWDGPLRDVVAATLDPDPRRRPTLESVLAWLRPQTTRPSPVLAAPPTAAPDAFDDALGLFVDPTQRDPFDDALDLFAAAPTLVEKPPPSAPPPPAPTLPVQPAALADAVTSVLPTEQPTPTRVETPPPAALPPRPTLPAPVGGYPQHPQHPQHPAYPMVLAPTPVEKAPLAERVRRGALVGAGATLTAALVAFAPWVTTFAVLVAVWLLRSGSLAASAAGARREQRGRRWYDGPQLLLHTPWHLVQSMGGAGMLFFWAAGLAAAAALLCYAVSCPLPITLGIVGGVLALGLWWGPGGSRLRGPLSRVIDPASRRTGPWLATFVALLVVALGVGAAVESRGVSWLPGSDRPFSDR